MEDNLLHTVSITWDVCSPMLSLKVLCRFSVYCEVCEQQHSTYSEHGDTCIDQTRPSSARSSTLKIVRGRLQSLWWFDWGEVWYNWISGRLGKVVAFAIESWSHCHMKVLLACENISFSLLFAAGFLRAKRPQRRRARRNGCFRRLRFYCIYKIGELSILKAGD